MTNTSQHNVHTQVLQETVRANAFPVLVCFDVVYTIMNLLMNNQILHKQGLSYSALYHYSTHSKQNNTVK